MEVLDFSNKAHHFHMEEAFCQAEKEAGVGIKKRVF
jgi:hypothetical protein